MADSNHLTCWNNKGEGKYMYHPLLKCGVTTELSHYVACL